MYAEIQNRSMGGARRVYDNHRQEQSESEQANKN